MKKLSVYNLEFPAYINTLDIVGYKFKRIADYATAFADLQHTIEVSGSEFPEGGIKGVRSLFKLAGAG